MCRLPPIRADAEKLIEFEKTWNPAETALPLNPRMRDCVNVANRSESGNDCLRSTRLWPAMACAPMPTRSQDAGVHPPATCTSFIAPSMWYVVVMLTLSPPPNGCVGVERRGRRAVEQRR